MNLSFIFDLIWSAHQSTSQKMKSCQWLGNCISKEQICFYLHPKVINAVSLIKHGTHLFMRPFHK